MSCWTKLPHGCEALQGGMRSVSLRKKSAVRSRGRGWGLDRDDALSARTSRCVLPDLESPAKGAPCSASERPSWRRRSDNVLAMGERRCPLSRNGRACQTWKEELERGILSGFSPRPQPPLFPGTYFRCSGSSRKQSQAWGVGGRVDRVGREGPHLKLRQGCASTLPPTTPRGADF